MSMWFFRLRSGSNTPLNSMERRRSSSERGPAQVTVELDHKFAPYSKVSQGGSSSQTTGPGGSSIPVSQTMSRLHSARSSTASYGYAGLGIYGDVPPLHRKSFLSGNLQNADSLDNVAQLIPRLVPKLPSISQTHTML